MQLKIYNSFALKICINSCSTNYSTPFDHFQISTLSTAYRFPIQSAGKYYLICVCMCALYLGQFHQQILDLNTQNYYLKTIDAAPRYVCLYPGEHPQLASLLEVTLKRPF